MPLDMVMQEIGKAVWNFCPQTYQLIVYHNAKAADANAV
jgi:hypothetical protein